VATRERTSKSNHSFTKRGQKGGRQGNTVLIQPLILLGFLVVGFMPRSANAEEIINIGSRRELFVDHFLIESMTGMRLQLQRARLAEVAIHYERSWEDVHAFYTTVFQEGDTYRMYYRGRHQEPQTTCYAESHDGIHWTKPPLGLVSFDGSTQNNILLPTARQFCPFIDLRPDTPLEQRYKANSRDPQRTRHLVGYVSADGIRWRKVGDAPIVPFALKNNFDSQNVMFWSEAEKRYVLYARHMEGGRRATARATSTDFLHWTKQVLMTYSDTETTTPSAHLYTNQTQPYFRAPHIYISLPGRIVFADQRHVVREDDKELARRRRLAVTPEVLDFYKKNVSGIGGQAGDVADAVFLTSRAGSTRFDFTFQESFVRPGIGLNNWTTRNNYPACGVVQTGSEEMSFYVQRNYSQKTAHLQRMTMRLDGFASAYAPYAGGEMRTRVLTFSGHQLEINYSTSAAGSIQIEVQSPSGEPLPGFTLNECSEIYGDHIERTVVWKTGSNVSQFAGKPVRLRFVMKDADLYSFRFRE